MKNQLITSFKILGVMFVLLGMVYPLVVTSIAQLAFPSKANGSLVNVNGVLRGSELIGQKTDTAIYFQSRPSATDYRTLASGGSNLGLTNKKLYELVQTRESGFRAKNNLPADVAVPTDQLFASASGLDPHISPEAAKIQIKRIAGARKFTKEQTRQLTDLVDKSIEAPQFGLFGCKRVNVLLLNLKLDCLK